MRKTLLKILKKLAKLTLKRYKPKIIAITGTVGKTSAKDACYEVLKTKFKVRSGKKSFNNEFGVPFTVLGIDTAGKNIFLWAFYIIRAYLRLIWTNYPKILILEYGVDKPNDMDYLLDIAVPDIVIVTAFSEIPAHVGNFGNPREVLREKSKLVKAMQRSGTVILNADYESVLEMKEKTKAKVMTFGFSASADLNIHEPEFKTNEGEGTEVPQGTSFKVEYNGSTIPIRLNAFGVPSVYAAAAACALGVALGLNLVDMSEALLRYKPPKGRFNVFEGINHSVLLDDTYNASLLSVEAALYNLKFLEAKRKVAILGSMLEMGRYSEEAHRKIGKMASKFCNVLICVGTETQPMIKEAEKNFMKLGRNLFYFDDADELKDKIKDKIKEGDVILIKGSQGIRLEKVSYELLANKKRDARLLPRQDSGWK